MNKKLFLLCLVGLNALTTSAQSISVDEALSKASALRSTRQHRAPSLSLQKAPQLAYTKTEKGKPLYYVFNYPDGGFAIMGGDESAREVLGYCEGSAFNIDSIPAGLRDILDMYDAQIAYAVEHPVSVPLRRQAPAPMRNRVEPLVKTKWGQGTPYNSVIPQISATQSFITGCEATAAAQLAKYYEWPKQGTGYYSYTKNYVLSGSTYPVTFSASYGTTTYDWSNMLDTYNKGYTSTQAQAVGTLMYHMGVGMDMNYNIDASSAPSIGPGRVLVNYMYYSPSAHLANRKSYSDTDWENLIYQELRQGHPVIYSGQTADSGHAFILHGYDPSLGFCINWGWTGYCDGYFPLTGTGALDSEGDGQAYVNAQNAYIGLVPDKDGPALLCPSLQLDNELFFSDKKPTATLNLAGATSMTQKMGYVYLYNNLHVDCPLDYTLMLENEQTGARYYSTDVNSITILHNSYSTVLYPTYQGKAVPDGSYKVLIVARNSESTNEADWQPALVPVQFKNSILTVTGSPVSELAELPISITDNLMEVSRTQQISVAPAYTGTLSFISSNPGVATVDKNGLVQGVSNGTAIITVKSADTSIFKATTKQFLVTVISKVIADPAPSLSLDVLTRGQTASITFASGYDGQPTYTSSNTSVAQVDAAGVITAVGNGEAYITVKAVETEFYGAVDATFCVRVIPQGLVIVGEPVVQFNDDATVSVTVTIINNSEEVYKPARVYYRFIPSTHITGAYSGYSGYTQLYPHKKGDVTITLPTQYCYADSPCWFEFYSDADKTIPMNVPSITFGYALPGDADANGKLDVADVNAIQSYLFDTSATIKQAWADANGDGKISIADIANIIQQLNKK